LPSPHKPGNVVAMRLTALRSLLLAATVLASPALAQEAPTPRIQDVVPEPPRPLIVVGEGEETPAPTIDAIPRVWSPSPRDEMGRTAYGLFLSGRSALSQGAFEQGAEFLGAVQTLTPEQPSVTEQATTAALLAGDLSYAARAASFDASLSPRRPSSFRPFWTSNAARPAAPTSG
jgi:hypothetical protein